MEWGNESEGKKRKLKPPVWQRQASDDESELGEAYLDGGLAVDLPKQVL